MEVIRIVSRVVGRVINSLSDKSIDISGITNFIFTVGNNPKLSKVTDSILMDAIKGNMCPLLFVSNEILVVMKYDINLSYVVFEGRKYTNSQIEDGYSIEVLNDKEFIINKENTPSERFIFRENNKWDILLEFNKDLDSALGWALEEIK